jgi:hypothetical protein
LTPAQWAAIGAQGAQATLPHTFVALRGAEWRGDAGHSVVFGSETLPDPALATLPEFYGWLAANPAAVAQFNLPAPGDFDKFALYAGAAEGVALQEVDHGGTPAELAFLRNNARGWRTAPAGTPGQITWPTETRARTGIVAPALTESDLLAAIRARRLFATEDENLAVALRLGGAWMGSVLESGGPLPLEVEVADLNGEALTLTLYDSSLPIAVVADPPRQWTATVAARPGHYFWAKVLQADGDTAYTAPVWIAGQTLPAGLYINEILPAPHDRDWDGNGSPDADDEWIELYNALDEPVGLGGWQLTEEAGASYTIPLGVTIPAHGFATFYYTASGLPLRNDGETISLHHLNGLPADLYSYTLSPGEDGVWCRLPDGSPFWGRECVPSPNAANWEMPAEGPLSASIYEAKRLTPGAEVRLRGHVTAPPGVLGEKTMYIQDETAGIWVYLPTDHRLYFNLGDKVEVIGKLRSYYEEYRIEVEERGDASFLEPGLPPPALPIGTQALLEPYEGRLVMVQGAAANFSGKTTFWLNDGSGPAKAVIRSETGVDRPKMERGTPVIAVGIVSQYSPGTPSRDDYRLLPRYQSDLSVPTGGAATTFAAASPPPGWPTLLPETGE